MRMTDSKINGIFKYLGSSFNNEEFSVWAKITCKYIFCSLQQCLSKKKFQNQQSWEVDKFVSFPLVCMFSFSLCVSPPLCGNIGTHASMYVRQGIHLTYTYLWKPEHFRCHC